MEIGGLAGPVAVEGGSSENSSLPAVESGGASCSIFLHWSKLYLKVNSVLTRSTERSRVLPMRARVLALRRGIRSWATAV